MADFIDVEIPWDSQPQELVELADNPYTAGLSFCAIPTGVSYFDLVTKTFGTVSGASFGEAFASNNGGLSTVDAVLARSFDATSTNKVEWPVSTTLRGAGMQQEGTILCLGATNSQVNATGYAFGGNSDSVSTGNGAGLMVDSNLHVGVGYVLRSNYQAPIGNSPSGLLGATFGQKLHFFGYGFAGNGATGHWFVGGQSTAWSGGSTHGTATANRRATIFQVGNDPKRKDVTIALLLFWDRKLSPGEYADLYANPWQLFAPQTIPVPVSAGGGTTISGNLGTAVASGHTGNVNANRTIAGALGTASATGLQGNVNANRTIAGALGVAVASGLAGNVNANRTIAGSLGVAVASGLQGTVSNSNNTVIAGNLGVAVASGLAANVNANTTIAGNIGVAVASGFSGSVLNGGGQPELQHHGAWGAPLSQDKLRQMELESEAEMIEIIAMLCGAGVIA